MSHCAAVLLSLFRSASALLVVLLSAQALCAGAPLPAQPTGVPWPTAEWPRAEPEASVDRAAFAAASAALFEPRGRGGLPDTRALLVVHHGRVVGEQYADGFSAESRFRSWSAAKSVTNALVAILAREGKLALDDPAPVPEWSVPGDPRAAITLRQLLQMSAGLDNADGEEGAFVGRLFFGDLSGDSAHGAAQRDVLFPPGTHWDYSTGTSQILSGVVARAVGGGKSAIRAFIERELAQPLGATSLVVEFDGSGTPLGGGYVWATARDWARLGTLYLRDGIWDGRRILPEGWVDFTRTPGPASDGRYGAHFWVAPFGSEIEAFAMQGNGGQFIAIVPDRDLVVVRLGEMHSLSWNDIGSLVGNLIAAFSPPSGAR